MLNNYFTLAIIHKNTLGVMKIRVYHLLLYLIIILFLGSIGFSSFIYYQYFQTKKLYSSYKELRKKILEQNISYKKINDALIEFSTDLQKFRDFDEKIRRASQQGNYDKKELKFDFNQKANDLAFFQIDNLSNKIDTQEKNIINQIRNIELNYKLRQDSFAQLDTLIKENYEKLIRTPSISPIKKGVLTSGYGLRVDPFTGNLKFHRGVDWAALPYSPVFSPADGTVIYSFYERSFGNLLAINHGYGIVTRYAHLVKAEVKPGAKVRRGDLIARVGNTGYRSTGNHLHYEIIVNGKQVDPLTYIIESKDEEDLAVKN